MDDDEKQVLLIDHGLREADLLRRLEQQTDWYQQRFNALRAWVNTEVRPLSEEAAHRYFAIVANGSPAPHEQADWRETMHGLKMRAEHAERALKTVETYRECLETIHYSFKMGNVVSGPMLETWAEFIEKALNNDD